MREWTLEHIKRQVAQKRPRTEMSLSKLRKATIEEGWRLTRNRPRHPDEERALDLLLTTNIKQAQDSGRFKYDPEKRVLDVAQYRSIT